MVYTGSQYWCYTFLTEKAEGGCGVGGSVYVCVGGGGGGGGGLYR